MEIGEINRPAKPLVDRFSGISTPTLSNALDTLGLRRIMVDLQPLGPGLRILGSAFTVHEVTGEIGSYVPEEAGLEKMLELGRAGDVLVVDNGGAKVSSGGDVFMFTAKKQGFAGMIVDGSVRDREGILEVGFPVFSRHVVPITGRGRVRVISMCRPIRCAGVEVCPGDIMVADGSGIAAVPQERAAEVLDLAKKQEAKDARMVELVEQALTHVEAGKKLKEESK